MSSPARLRSAGTTGSPRWSDGTAVAVVCITAAVATTQTAAIPPRTVSCLAFIDAVPSFTGTGRRGRRIANNKAMIATRSGTTPTFTAVIQFLRSSTLRRSANCTSRNSERIVSNWARKPSIALTCSGVSTSTEPSGARGSWASFCSVSLSCWVSCCSLARNRWSASASILWIISNGRHETPRPRRSDSAAPPAICSTALIDEVAVVGEGLGDLLAEQRLLLDPVAVHQHVGVADQDDVDAAWSSA